MFSFQLYAKVSFSVPIWCRVVRRRRGAAAAADRMSASRRRRFRGMLTSCRTRAIMLLDFCNAVYNESWTLTKGSKNDAGVFCDSPWYSNVTWQRQSKVFSWTILWKWQMILKVSYGTSYKIWLKMRMVQWKISTACTLITAYKLAK